MTNYYCVSCNPDSNSDDDIAVTKCHQIFIGPHEHFKIFYCEVIYYFELESHGNIGT